MMGLYKPIRMFSIRRRPAIDGRAKYAKIADGALQMDEGICKRDAARPSMAGLIMRSPLNRAETAPVYEQVLYSTGFAGLVQPLMAGRRRACKYPDRFARPHHSPAQRPRKQQGASLAERRPVFANCRCAKLAGFRLPQGYRAAPRRGDYRVGAPRRRWPS